MTADDQRDNRATHAENIARRDNAWKWQESHGRHAEGSGSHAGGETSQGDNASRHQSPVRPHGCLCVWSAPSRQLAVLTRCEFEAVTVGRSQVIEWGDGADSGLGEFRGGGRGGSHQDRSRVGAQRGRRCLVKIHHVS